MPITSNKRGSSDIMFNDSLSLTEYIKSVLVARRELFINEVVKNFKILMKRTHFFLNLKKK